VAILDDMRRKEREATFGGRLKTLRLDAGLTQEQLTVALLEQGVSIGRTYVSELERAETNRMPNGEVIAAMARALGANGNYLLMIDRNPEPPGENGPVFFSPEADNVAQIVDTLPPWRRVDALRLMQALAESSDELRHEIGAATTTVEQELRAAGLVLGEAGLRAIEAALERALLGTGQATGS
jgi:transcriptional regulator with XRE-family HTH domain